jgi:hypothetical protein
LEFFFTKLFRFLEGNEILSCLPFLSSKLEVVKVVDSHVQPCKLYDMWIVSQWRCPKWYSHWENFFKVSFKHIFTKKNKLSVTQFQITCPGNMQSYVHSMTCTHMFLDNLFAVVQN